MECNYCYIFKEELRKDIDLVTKFSLEATCIVENGFKCLTSDFMHEKS